VRHSLHHNVTGPPQTLWPPLLLKEKPGIGKPGPVGGSRPKSSGSSGKIRPPKSSSAAPSTRSVPSVAAPRAWLSRRLSRPSRTVTWLVNVLAAERTSGARPSFSRSVPPSIVPDSWRVLFATIWKVGASANALVWIGPPQRLLPPPPPKWNVGGKPGRPEP